MMAFITRVTNIALGLLLFVPARGFVVSPALSSNSRISSKPLKQSFFDFFTKTEAIEEVGISKSTDPDYPQNFTGRLCFLPSLVKVPESGPGSSVNLISLFGYSLGGTVALEYDTSPVGPYREYVTMASLVAKNGIGQWGSRLYVSTQKAEDVCKEIWGVPAELANIDFVEGRNTRNGSLMVTSLPNPDAPTRDVQNIQVEGWQETRIQSELDDPKRGPCIPAYWTPTIKALWAPLVFNINSHSDETLALHKLRISASAVRLRWTGFQRDVEKDDFSDPKYNLGIPIPIGLAVDNVLIEIGTRRENGL
uniref:Uncharacterized protein n=1 Tax=Chaetoceros debilis TaxID=122233 RepID=A0A7S3Q512_9STRA|mmetsp:Transcript_20414/g.30986  ORF Transcript_20414/g.30986 Transcript_20414/m.30986 type:complete len:308 (+) Transcript_20414:68-991(+)